MSLSTEAKLDMDLDTIMSARKEANPPAEEMKKKRGRDDDEGSRSNRRVYVSNLAWSVSWQDLKDFFRKAGVVVYASVMQDNGRSKGRGVVEFETPEEAALAIETLNDVEFEGRPISVREDREENTRRQSRNEPRDEVRPASSLGRRVFVSNLAWSTSWQDLKDYFRQVGKVAYASVMTEDDTGRSKGCGIVEFETSDEANKAIQTMHDTELDGRKIIVREDREDREVKTKSAPPPRSSRREDDASQDVIRVGRRVYVGNLSWSTSWQDLKDFFRLAGTVVYANVMTEDDTGRSKGCGIVEFETSEQAVGAIEKLHDTELDGRRLTVREDREDKDLKGAGGPVGRSSDDRRQRAKRSRNKVQA